MRSHIKKNRRSQSQQNLSTNSSLVLNLNLICALILQRCNVPLRLISTYQHFTTPHTALTYMWSVCERARRGCTLFSAVTDLQLHLTNVITRDDYRYSGCTHTHARTHVSCLLLIKVDSCWRRNQILCFSTVITGFPDDGKVPSLGSEFINSSGRCYRI